MLCPTLGWKPRINDEVCLLKTKLSTALRMFTAVTPISKTNQKCTMDYSSCKQWIDVLALNYKAMFSALVP